MAAECRETGHLSSLAALLQLPAERARRGLPRQVAANLLSAIDTFLLLITPPPPVAQKMVLGCQSQFSLISPWVFYLVSQKRVWDGKQEKRVLSFKVPFSVLHPCFGPMFCVIAGQDKGRQLDGQ